MKYRTVILKDSQFWLSFLFKIPLILVTDWFYRYVDDGTSNGIEDEWSEVPEEWRGEDDPDYTEEFRELAEMELDGKERHMVLSALVKKG